METVSIGEVIRRRREEWGVSQEMVCEGLCTSMTLSRFESGQQTPSRDCVVTMLQRLGLPDDSYYAQLTKEELRQITLRKEILACSSMYVRTTGEERKLFRADALKKIKELECIAKKDDVVSRQFLVARKANWIEKSDEYSRNEIMDMLLGAIRLTVPQFDLDEINRCLYSENEISLIIDIAVQYSRSGQRRKAEDILRQLIKMLQKRYPNHIRLPLAASLVPVHLAVFLQLTGGIGPLLLVHAGEDQHPLHIVKADVDDIPHGQVGKPAVLGDGGLLAKDEIADRQAEGKAAVGGAELGGAVVIAHGVAPDRAVGTALLYQLQKPGDVLPAPGFAVGEAALLAQGGLPVYPVHHLLDRLLPLEAEGGHFLDLHALVRVRRDLPGPVEQRVQAGPDHGGLGPVQGILPGEAAVGLSL